MKAIFGVILAFALSAAAHGAPLKGKMQLAVPPVWDPISRTFFLPEMVPVKQANSLENCNFYGGFVTIKKVEGDKVYFDKLPKARRPEFCDHLVTSAENIKAWDIHLVEEQKQQFSRASSAFRQQLNADVSNILEKKDNCLPSGSDLRIGSRYELGGSVFWYGANTAAMTAQESDSCHVEINGDLQVLGFDRTGEFMLAVYHQPVSHVENVEVVDFQLKHKMKRTCREGEKVVVPVTKIRSQFQLVNVDHRSGILSRMAKLLKFNQNMKSCAVQAQ
ncbi:MAG TPA: hypothetical protein VIH99_02545 [Bdellovibrionota bacterium]|jgi:hypothetical protein